MSRGQMPVGTVTFLFTDIVGSTKLWELDRDGMQAALARHDELMAGTIAANNGHVFKTIGDAFCASFAFAPDAVSAALTAQQRLASEPWPEETPIRVRMAIHSGAIESRDDDYFGPPVNRVARLLAIGHGGQILLSAAAHELIRDDLPEGVAMKSVGEHRLRDLGRPEVVFQLVHPSLASVFPPLRSLDNPELRHNLPQQLTSFVGRESQIAEVKAMMERTRLLTLTGSGGAGKTRLALQVAAEILDGDVEGVWLAELAPLTNPGLVASTVAAAAGVKEEAGKTVAQSLFDFLKHKAVLVVLDNCEHLLDEAARLSSDLLQKCPGVRILATSREALGIAGETAYRVPSLSLPDPRVPQTVESLTHFEAVRLFIDRASQAQTSFAVTNKNAPALASVCLQLDGIPLAIELAAARVRTLTLEDIDRRLDSRFQLLTGGSRTALPRQQTLRSLIDWSYDLLNEQEKALLSRLSAFGGGWTLEAAEAICNGNPIADSETLDLLASLVDKSLVVAETTGENSRFRLLETVKQYARDRLIDTGDGAVWRSNHLEYFMKFAEAAVPFLTGPEAKTWFERLGAEQDNLRAALDWSGVNLETHPANLRMAEALWRFWSIRGHYTEGSERLATALALNLAGDPLVRCKALVGAGGIANWQGDFATAVNLLEESRSIAEELGDKGLIAHSLNTLGYVVRRSGDYARARGLLEKSLVLYREWGNVGGTATALGNLGETILLAGGDVAAAKALIEESLSLTREIGDPGGTANALRYLGSAALIESDFVAARTRFEESLSLYRELGFFRGIVASIEGLAAVSTHNALAERSARIFGAAASLRAQHGFPVPAGEQTSYDAQLAAVRAALADDAIFEAHWAAGQSMSVDAAVGLALSGPEA